MTRVFSAGGSRQPAVFSAILALHFGIFLAIVYGLVPREIPVTMAEPPDVELLPPEAESPAPVEPGQPELYGRPAEQVPQPPLELPTFEPEETSSRATPEAGPAAGGEAGAGPRVADYVAPALRTPRERMASVVDSCYPAASRRLHEEGRVLAWIALDAQGAVTAWRVAGSSGFPRLDAAVQCVLDRLQFVAGRRDGRAVASEATLPVAFRLD